MTTPRQIGHLRPYFKFTYLVFFVAITLITPHVFAQQPIAAQAVTVQNNSDIRVLIDVSGSMKQNDPRNLRRPALDLLVQLFPTDSRAGIWTFGKYVNMLAAHKTVSKEWRNQSSNKSRLINSVALHTNIGLALEKAIYDGGQKKYSDANDFNTSVILLTDGVVDIAKDPQINEQERQRILDELLPRYQAAGVTLHAVALSTNADVELLERLAIETDGIFAVAEDAEDLNRIFLRAFDQSSPSNRAPLEDNRFLIDSSIEEFTALVFKQEGSEATNIQSPSGQVFNTKSEGASLRWFASDAYDLITIQQPEEGEWRINADIDPENRVTVVSNLTLAIAPIANNLYHGEVATLTASLLESGQIVSNSALLDLLTVNASLSRANTTFWRQVLVRENLEKENLEGENLEGKSNDTGIYHRDLDMLRNSGDYALNVVVDGKTFKREKTLKFTVREPFRVELAANELEGEFTLTVMADDKRLRTHDVALSAVIKQPNGSELTVDLLSEQAGVWSYQAVEQGTGSYVIHLLATGYNTEARAVNYALAEQELYLNVPGIAEPEVISEPVIEKDDEKDDEKVVELEAIADTVIEQQEVGKKSSNWLPYIALIAGNLLLIGLLFFIYKKMMGSQPAASKKSTVLEDDVEDKDIVEENSDEENSDEENSVEENSDEENSDTENSDVEKSIDKNADEHVDIDAVDISVDEASAESTTEPTTEPTAQEAESILEEDTVKSSDLNTLLDVESDHQDEHQNEHQDKNNQKEIPDAAMTDAATPDAATPDAATTEEDIDSDGAESSDNTIDDVDIEFDLSTNDDSTINNKK